MATILVDLDGTLLPLSAWNPVFAEACAVIAEKAGVSPEEVWRRARQRNLALMRRLDWRAFDWQAILDSVAEELGAGRAPDIVTLLRKHLPGFQLSDGAVEALEGLKALGHRVEIATNGHAAYQLPVIRRLGLDRLVDGVRTSDVYKCPKTCPEFFNGAHVMVGDNPVFDVYFPKRFGLLAVFYGNWEREALEYSQRLLIPAYNVRPDAAVETLRELPRTVEAVLKNKSIP